MLDIQKRLSNSFYILLSLPASAMGFALSVQIAALSWILSTQYGLNIEEIGLVWAAGPIAGIFGQIIFGVVSDQAWFWGGRRRPFILIGGTLAALMLLALPNIDIISAGLGIDGILGVAITVALMLDLAINVGFNPTRSIIADVTPEGKARTAGYTWMQTISGTLGMMAYIIGAIFGNYALIYGGAAIVLLLSIVPTFFIEEPKELAPTGEPGEPAPRIHLMGVLNAIQPLWGFLLYGIYGISSKLVGYKPGHYWAEIACLALTVFLIARSLAQRESGHSKTVAGQIGFRKVLAAHSFTWIGVQTMFIYMFAYVKDQFPALSDDQMGQVVSISFLILNGVAAVLPAFVLRPLTLRIGRVRTHLLCIAVMAAGYAGLWLAGISPYLIYGYMALLGVGWAATVSLPFAIMSQKVDQSRMGLYMGLFNLSVVLPQLVASLGVGTLIQAAENKNVIFLVCTVCLAFSAVAWSFVKDEAATDT